MGSKNTPSVRRVAHIVQITYGGKEGGRERSPNPTTSEVALPIPEIALLSSSSEECVHMINQTV